MLQENRFHARVVVEDAHQFDAAIAPECRLGFS
jgi:hypothetical protein